MKVICNNNEEYLRLWNKAELHNDEILEKEERSLILKIIERTENVLLVLAFLLALVAAGILFSLPKEEAMGKGMLLFLPSIALLIIIIILIPVSTKVRRKCCEYYHNPEEKIRLAHLLIKNDFIGYGETYRDGKLLFFRNKETDEVFDMDFRVKRIPTDEETCLDIDNMILYQRKKEESD